MRLSTDRGEHRRRNTLPVVGALLVVGAALVVGVLSNWTLAFGIFWFGASAVALLAVAHSFRKDMIRRFPNE